jgi:hypothetical protein
MAFIDVLLTLLLPIVVTFGSFTGASGLRIPLPLLFMMAVLLFGAGGFTVLLEGTLVLLLRTFLLSFALSALLISFAFSYLTFSANLNATAFAIFLIC